MNKTTSAIAAAAGLAVSANAATLINTYPSASTSNIVATASSIEPNTSVNGPDRTVIEANNGFNPATGVHGTGTQSTWRSNQSETMGTQWIQWDLGASYQLGSIQVWNFNDAFRRAGGIRQVDIYLSNTVAPGDPEGAGAANWSLWAEDAILDPGSGLAGYTGFDLETVVGSSLPSSDIRYVRFEVDSTFRSDGIDLNALDGGITGTGDAAGVSALAQIEFYEIPEPGAALLGSLGLLSLLRRRRG